MSPGSLLAVAAIQLAALLVPLAAGVAGLVSGATAGLASVAVWFLLGIPLSYAAVDHARLRGARRPAERGVPALLASPAPLKRERTHPQKALVFR